MIKGKKTGNLSRTEYLAKNAAFGVLGKLFGIIITFVSRTVFIYYLGKSYLGINGLYSEILSLLSFAELGIGSAITFSLYTPIANKDEEKITQLIGLYKKLYIIIAFTILGIGLALVPFLQHIVKDADRITLGELRLYFVIFLLNTVSTYVVAHKSSFITAQQREYVIKKLNVVTDLISFLVQMISLVVFKNYLAYLLASLVMTWLVRIYKAFYFNKIEPVLTKKSKEKLPKEDVRAIYKNVRALAIQKFATVAISATDNIIISMTAGLGVLVVGVVSNYNAIITSVTAAISMIFGSVTAGFGNLVALSSSEHYYNTFKEINFINFWIYGFAMIACFVLLSPFITLWIGSEYLIDAGTLFLITLCSYILGQNSIYNLVRAAKGEFIRDSWVSFVGGIINLVVSIVAARYLGLIGIYIGTLATRLVLIICKVVVTHKFLFDKSALNYFKQFFVYLITVFLTGGITYIATAPLLENVTVLRFAIALMITAVLPNGIFVAIFHKTNVFQNVALRIRKIIFKR